MTDSPSSDGGMLVPPEVEPFIQEILNHDGCIVRYKPVAMPAEGMYLLTPASMEIDSVEWLDER